MKLTGKVILDKTPGRKDPWVKKQVQHDYFLALQITHVDDTPVKDGPELFSLVWPISAPSILIDKKSSNNIFTQPVLPAGVKDIPHITLGNFPDFRSGRSVEQDIDESKVAAARELQDTIVTLEVSDSDYELVIASKDQALIDQVKQRDLISFEDGDASVTFTATVGPNRDAVFNIKLGIEAQKKLSELSKQVFGKEFELWNSLRQKIEYHVTLAQASGLTTLLKDACEEAKKSDVSTKSEMEIKTPGLQ